MAQGNNKKIVLAAGLLAVALVAVVVMYTSRSDSSPTVKTQAQPIAEDATDLDETSPVAERQRGTGDEGAGSTRLAADSSDQSETGEAEGEDTQTKKRKRGNTRRKKSRRNDPGNQEGDEEEAPKTSKKPSRRPFPAP